MPVIIVVRAGAQTGAFDQHWVKRIDVLASRSILGVVENESP
jgi:hypothetical protein